MTPGLRPRRESTERDVCAPRIVPTAQRGSHPFDASDDNASRTIRLFPTPAAPLTRIPDQPRIRYRGLDGSHLLGAADQRPRQAHIESLERGEKARRAKPDIPRAVCARSRSATLTA